MIPVPLFGLPVGPELLIILLILVLLFGPQKLPQLARSAGEAFTEFKRGREQLEDEIEDEIEDSSEDN